ncbi:MAG: hypothetical protein L6R42_011112, partial [Xanthoria sp. 1 TBL-2021]
IINLYKTGRMDEAKKLQAVVARGDWAAISGGIVGTKSALETHYGYGGVALVDSTGKIVRLRKTTTNGIANLSFCRCRPKTSYIRITSVCVEVLITRRKKVYSQTLNFSTVLSTPIQLTMGGGPKKSEHLLVILPFDPPNAIFDRIRRNHPHIKITFHQLLFSDVPWRARSQVPPELFQDATFLITLSALPPSSKDCPNLELIHFTSAGTNHIADSPIYTNTKIPLTTSSGIHGPQIAEWVLMTMLTSSHHFALLHKWQNNHRWGQDDQSGIGLLRNLHDKVGQRLGVLGYGSIGRQVGN